MSVFVSMLNDPYIQKELKKLSKQTQLISKVLNKKAHSIASEDYSGMMNPLKDINTSSSDSLDSVIRVLLTIRENTNKISDLNIYEELVQQLPNTGWKGYLLEDLSNDKEANRLLDTVKQMTFDVKQFDSINRLQSFYKEVQKILTNLEKILPNEELEQLEEARSYTNGVIRKQIEELFPEGPVSKAAELAGELEIVKKNPNGLLESIHALNEQLKIAKTQTEVSIGTPEHRTLSETYLNTDKSYRQAIEWLIQQYPNVNAHLKEKILGVLDIAAFNSLTNKQEFISFLEPDAVTFAPKTESEAKFVLVNKLGAFLVKRAKSATDIIQGFSLLNLIPFNKIQGDHQVLIAELLLTNDRDLLTSVDVEGLLEKVKTYNRSIRSTIARINSITSIKKMKKALKSHFLETWTTLDENKKDIIARQYLLKVGFHPYQSLKRIESDFENAKLGNLVHDEDQGPIKCNLVDGIIQLNANGNNDNEILVRPELQQFNNKDATDTLTLIFN